MIHADSKACSFLENNKTRKSQFITSRRRFRCRRHLHCHRHRRRCHRRRHRRIRRRRRRRRRSRRRRRRRRRDMTVSARSKENKNLQRGTKDLMAAIQAGIKTTANEDIEDIEETTED